MPTFWRQKNIRTKENIEYQTDIQASLMFFCHSMHLHHRCYVYNCFCWKEQKGLRHCIILLYSHSWLGPGIWCSWTVGCLFYRKHLCRHWDKIPGPGQGWRCRGHWAVALWKYTFKRQKNIRTKETLKNLISTQMDLMYIPILQCLHLRWLSATVFCYEEQKILSFASFKNTVLCTAIFLPWWTFGCMGRSLFLHE